MGIIGVSRVYTVIYKMFNWYMCHLLCDFCNLTCLFYYIKLIYVICHYRWILLLII